MISAFSRRSRPGRAGPARAIPRPRAAPVPPPPPRARCRSPREERVLGGAEAGPQRVVLLARRASGRLPLLHEVAERGCRHRPVGGRRQLLGARDELLLGGAHLDPLLVELPEVLPALA